eukprot:2081515-Amphidinium_carterae.1
MMTLTSLPTRSPRATSMSETFRASFALLETREVRGCQRVVPSRRAHCGLPRKPFPEGWTAKALSVRRDAHHDGELAK